MKYLRANDGITVNRDHLLYDAKHRVLAMDQVGYRPPQPVKIPVVGETGYNVLRLGVYNMLQSGYISRARLQNCFKAGLRAFWR